jgi:NAD(P)-dependent dehydrogenase (short-subunit alcohol dehydrogenase family)
LFGLEDKVIVVTGGAGLLGKNHCEAIAEYGGIPVIFDKNREAIDETLALLSKKGFDRATGYSVDLSSESQIKSTTELVITRFGKINGLINNAANNPKIESGDGKDFSRLENFPLDEWERDIAVGLTGAFLCSKHIGAKMAKQNSEDVILNISSDLGLIAPDQRLYEENGRINSLQPVKPVTYSVVKTALIGLTRYLSTYWVDQGVRSNVLCPGGVENGQKSEFLNRIQKAIPMGRMAKPDEYKGAIVWMMSDASRYMNGSVVSVDGGRTAW